VIDAAHGLLLVVRQGWLLDNYERWLVEAISDALLPRQ
jgi:hypothetical protein